MTVALPRTCFSELSIQGQKHLVCGYWSWSQQRHQVEAYISACFRKEHNASLTHFLPLLITLENERHEILAVAGIRFASNEALFLEQYLDQPIESVISTYSCTHGHRNSVAEIGNLAATTRGASRYLFSVLTDLLSEWGVRWIACTGTSMVLNIFHRLQMHPTAVAKANPERLSSKGADWGNYYDKNPSVIVGNVLCGQQIVSQSGILKKMGYQRQPLEDVLTA